MNKKAIAILGAIFILIVGTLGFLIYSKTGGSSNTKTTATPTPTPTPIAQNSPTPTPQSTPTQTQNQPASGKFYKLTDDQVISPALTFDGSGVAYFTKQGLLYRATFNQGAPLTIGDKKQLAIEQKSGISKVLWTTATQDFMLVYDTLGRKSYEFYNNSTGKFAKLPSQVYSLGFMPAGDKVFYIWSNQTGNDTVNLSDPTTQNYKNLGEIWEKNSIVYVSPDGLNVAYHQDPNLVTGISNPLYLTDTDAKTWHKIVDGFVAGVLWSPDGKKLLFGKKDPGSQAYQLWYYDLYSSDVKNLGVTTMPEKAVWGSDNQTIFVAVSNSQSNNGITTDIFYKINLSTGERKTYDPGSQQIDGRDMFLSQDQSNLFFRNAQDGGLYYLDLN